MKTLDVGCGVNKVPGSVGMDANPAVHPDVVHDMNDLPWPFEPDSFDRVVCLNSMEHTPRVLEVMEELHRITRAGGEIYISSPHFSSHDFYTDPTHQHAFSSRSFDYFVPGTQLHDLRYSSARFGKRKVRITFDGYPPGLRHLLERIANAAPVAYERFFAYWFPAHQIQFFLEVLK